jgi:hypothetical protein
LATTQLVDEIFQNAKIRREAIRAPLLRIANQTGNQPAQPTDANAESSEATQSQAEAKVQCPHVYAETGLSYPRLLVRRG